MSSSGVNPPNDDAVGHDLIGRKLGDYRILRRLGAGGMAEVYLAEQESLGRQVALKTLQTSLSQDATYVQRFQNEARAVASLVDAHIVQIYEVGEVDGVHFIAQEYVAGTNLAQTLRREGALAPRMVLDILRQVAGALAKAYDMGIVHRDLKPANLFRIERSDGSKVVKVLDFGIS
ncbi:MAG: serine/threonine protein kinase, partial [Planctomycetales bacterium]|nr:serine/threonine protein kinase [Planctomycetales bacterium]